MAASLRADVVELVDNGEPELVDKVDEERLRDFFLLHCLDCFVNYAKFSAAVWRNTSTQVIFLLQRILKRVSQKLWQSRTLLMRLMW